MLTDFSQPQRQAPIGILVMFLDTVRESIAVLWPLLAIFIFKENVAGALYTVAAISVVFIGICITAYFKYLNFTFYIDAAKEEFIISSGVFNKTKTVIRLDKIQQVNITQSLIQRIIGVYAIDVDTAGSNKKEAKIKAVSHEFAISMKERLLEEVGTTPESKVSTPEATHAPFMRVSLPSLFKVGITSNYVKSFWLLVVFFGSIYDNVRHLGSKASYATDKVSDFGERLIMQSIAFVICLIIGVILLINIVRVVVRYFDFTIIREQGSLLLSFGLINTKSTIIKPEKVQVVTVTQNYFQKKLNINEVSITQAAGGERHEKNAAIDIPGCNNSERDSILQLLFHGLPQKGSMMKPNWRKFGFSVFLIIILPLSVFYGMGFENEPRIGNYALLVPVYAVLAAIFLYLGFRKYRIFINEKFIIKQSGAWDISNDIIEPGKIQAITTSQLFWHKSLNIGSLTIHTAGGNVKFSLGDYNRISEYVNLWLYELETTDKNWM